MMDSAMLALAGLVLLLVSPAVFYWTLRRGLYRRYPYEQFVLVGGATVLGLASTLEQATAWRVGLLAVELASLVAVSVYFGLGARFPRSRIRIEAGDRFPDVALTDSRGGLFDPRSLRGKASALYLFYRGDW